MRSVLLINPHSVVLKGTRFSDAMKVNLPLGLAYIAAVIEQMGLPIQVLDLAIEDMDREDFRRYIEERQPEIVGITSTVNTFNNALRIAHVVKEVNSATRVILGGVQATFAYKEALGTGDVDFVCMYEGEETIRELIEQVDAPAPRLREIKGIAFRDGDELVVTPKRPLIADINQIAFPARHLFKVERYFGPMSIITGRGCPSQCIFCSAKSFYERYRARNCENIIQEIHQLVEQFQVKSLFIADDSFTINRKRLVELLNAFKRENLQLTWSCESRIDTIDEEIIHLMREAGCVGIQFGVESGNQQVLNAIGKGIKLEDVRRKVHQANAAGISVMASFIIGHPMDTRETIQDTLQFASDLVRNRPNPDIDVRPLFALLTPLPGTYLHEHADELGVKILTENWDRYTFADVVMETSHLSAYELRTLHYEASRLALEIS